jgi:protein phosphatase-4 regulatory subunit 3
MLLLSDEFYVFTLGALECFIIILDDKEFYQKEIKHRSFFKNLVRYNQAIDLKDKNMINLIHFNYRLNYVKDCALAHVLDERALGLL